MEPKPCETCPEPHDCAGCPDSDEAIQKLVAEASQNARDTRRSVLVLSEVRITEADLDALRVEAQRPAPILLLHPIEVVVSAAVKDTRKLGADKPDPAAVALAVERRLAAMWRGVADAFYTADTEEERQKAMDRHEDAAALEALHDMEDGMGRGEIMDLLEPDRKAVAEILDETGGPDAHRKVMEAQGYVFLGADEDGRAIWSAPVDRDEPAEPQRGSVDFWGEDFKAKIDQAKKNRAGCAVSRTGKVPPSCDVDDGETCDACEVEAVAVPVEDNGAWYRTHDHTLALLYADLDALWKVVREACAILGVTDDDEKDWPKLPGYCERFAAASENLARDFEGLYRQKLIPTVPQTVRDYRAWRPRRDDKGGER